MVHVAVLAAASGFFTARSMERSDARRSAADALHVIAERIQARDAQSVLREIRSLDHSDDPDRDAYDLLVELPEFTDRLRMESPALAGDSHATSDTIRH